MVGDAPSHFEGGETLLLDQGVLDYWRGYDGTRGLEAASIVERHDPTPFGRLLVFDLDHTLWTPELYKLRRLEGYETAAPPGPTAGEDVRLFPGAAAVLEELATSPKWRGTTCACASPAVRSG